MTSAQDFSVFFKEVEPRMRYALVAAHGPDRGLDATAEAFAYGWEHWDRISVMDNPAGYLYRVGSRHARKRPKVPPVFPEASVNPAPLVEPGLGAALRSLSPRQRVVVALVCGHGLTHRETAQFLGVTTSTVQRHVERGLSKLRQALGVRADA